MKLYHVVAVSDGNVIGKANRLPWHLSADLKHFKKLTTGSTVIMGRKTFESIGGKPLPARENFVLSRSQQPCHSERSEESRRSFALRAQDDSFSKRPQGHLKFFDSLEDALKNVSTKHCYITGGSSLYEQTIDRVDGIYLTRIHAQYEGDTYYPEIPTYFKEKSREKLQEEPKIEVIFYENTKKT